MKSTAVIYVYLVAVATLVAAQLRLDRRVSVPIVDLIKDEDEYVPVDYVKYEERTKEPENVTGEEVAKLIESLPKSIIYSKDGKLNNDDQAIMTNLYNNIDTLFQLNENDEITFEQNNLKDKSFNKTLIDTIKIENEPGKVNASYGVYFHGETEVAVTEPPKILVTRRPIYNLALNKIGLGFFKFIRTIIKLIKFIVKVVGYLSSKCIRICPPWKNRICAYSPIHGYMTYKNYCVFKREVCRGAQFVYVRKGKC